MGSGPQLRIRYWGVTGTLARSLSPSEVADKLTAAIQKLLRQESLGELMAAQSDMSAIRRHIDAHLPFYLRSTYGGNSTCVEVQTPEELLILDCGSGFRDLGRELVQRWNAQGFTGRRAGHILLTHAHVDHISAIPFVEPLYDPANHFTLWAPQKVLDSLEAVFGEKSRLTRIYVPTNYAEMSGIREFYPIVAGEEFAIGQTRVAAYSLNHPGGCVAYRIEHGGRTMVFATDHEHVEVPDLGLAEFARDADLLYLDAHYLQAEYDGAIGICHGRPASHHGWGHSTIEAAAATAVAAGARLLHLGHHEPARDDAELQRIEQLAEGLLSDALHKAGRPVDSCRVQMAREELTVEI